jgi:hypothetical protein
MATAAELALKVEYALHSIDRTRALTRALEVDLHKRIIGKAGYVFVDSSIELLRRLNTLVPGRKRHVRGSLNKASDDYEDTFAIVRDKMHAHRQEVPPLDALSSWRNLHDDYLAYFRSEFHQAYEMIRQRESSLPSIGVAADLSDEEKRRIREACALDDRHFNVSKQGLYSSSGSSVMLSGPAERGQEVLDVFDGIELCTAIHQAVDGNAEYEQLTATFYMTESIALFDVLYSDQNPTAELRELSLLDRLRAFEWPGTPMPNADWPVKALEDAERQITARGVRDRSLRNKIAAHLDADEPLPNLIADVNAYDWKELVMAVDFSRNTFVRAFEYGPIIWKVLAKHRVPITGILGVHHSDPPAPYDAADSA